MRQLRKPAAEDQGAGADQPAWLTGRALAGTFAEVGVRVRGRELSVRIWSPAERALPLLIAHDGPEYDALASLTRFAGAMIERGALPPFRVALLAPGERDEWYSASAVYGRALSQRIVPALCREVPVAGHPAGMGASLGAVAMLQAQRAWPGTFSGLFLQSGSFFVPRFDRHESRFPRYGRIVRFVRGVVRAGFHPEPLPAVMTCGAKEENVYNNRVVVEALSAQGYDARLYEVAGRHNYPSWRDTFDPHLTGFLWHLWSAR
jgi:enterochelin esterase-like enzyme